MSAVLIRLIHVACRDLGVDQDTRRDLQERVTGKASLSAMTDAEHEAVLDELKRQGFKPSASGKARPVAARGDTRFAHVLWGKLVRAGKVKVKGAAGLNAFVRERFGDAWGAVPIDIDQMQDHDQIATVIEALKSMCRRYQIKVTR
jgi:Protein of unknown function (DUF1018)